MKASIDRRRSGRVAPWLDRALVGYFVMVAVAVFGLWAGYFSSGTAAVALFEHADEVATLLGRTSGAALASVVLATGAIGRRMGRHWAPPLTVFGAGMVGYAALNTLGETLPSDPIESVLLVLALMGALVAGSMTDDHAALLFVSAFLAGCAAWLVGRAMYTGGGSLTKAVTVTALPAPHYVAEATMALVTVAGLLAWRRGRAWGIRAALAGLGMYCYSTLSALDWAYFNDRTIVPLLTVTLGAAITGALHLMTTEETSNAHRHRPIGPGRASDGSGRHPIRQQG